MSTCKFTPIAVAKRPMEGGDEVSAAEASRRRTKYRDRFRSWSKAFPTAYEYEVKKDRRVFVVLKTPGTLYSDEKRESEEEAEFDTKEEANEYAKESTDEEIREAMKEMNEDVLVRSFQDVESYDFKDTTTGKEFSLIDNDDDDESEEEDEDEGKIDPVRYVFEKLFPRLQRKIAKMHFSIDGENSEDDENGEDQNAGPWTLTMFETSLEDKKVSWMQLLESIMKFEDIDEHSYKGWILEGLRIRKMLNM